MICLKTLENNNGATTRPAGGGESCGRAAAAGAVSDIRHDSPPQSRRLNRGTGSRLAARRGNSLILVTALLVLLVIVASAYISRVQGARGTGAATQYMIGRDSIFNVIADDIAKELTEALFARPVDRAPISGGPPLDSNTPRLAIPSDGVRYSPAALDLADVAPLGRIRFNVPPFETIPYTNWPDTDDFPLGENNTSGIDLSTLGLGEGNPWGEPGTGDSRWLCCFEPIRWQMAGTDGSFGSSDDFSVFSHWRHMTNIAHANNGYRICKDISDITGAKGAAQSIGGGGLVTDLSIPVEQWLAIRPGGTGANSATNASTGLPMLPQDFFGRMTNWFRRSNTNGYEFSYTNPALIPPNFLRLCDLDGDGSKFNFGDRPADEFIPGTARHMASRVLCDTDGDGFTDSFWFLAPSSIDRGVRSIVGIRVVDNAAMANVNVATRFVPSDTGPFTDFGTRGQTPADLAFVGELRLPGANLSSATLNSWNVGFCDFPGHSSPALSAFPGDGAVNYFMGLGAPTTFWLRHLAQTGLDQIDNGFGHFTRDARMLWWLNVGVEGPLTPTPVSGFTPFTFADELEFRMYHGNNNPWSYGRLEDSLALSMNTADTFVRAAIQHEETAEFLDKRTNRGLLIDKRRMLTTYNATRNDLMPPYLWAWEGPTPAHPDRLLAPWWDFDIRARQKLDLRATRGDYLRDNGLHDDDDRQYLYQVLRRALLEEFPAAPSAPLSYYGGTTDGLARSDRLAAGLATNIKSYADEDQLAPLDESIIVVPNPIAVAGEARMYGLEKQPFIVEVMIGHVYHSQTQAVANHPDSGEGDILAGNTVVCGNTDNTTFVVVQIANPFDTPITLDDTHEFFEIDVFGQQFSFRALSDPLGGTPLTLPPATYGTPTTLTIVAIDQEIIPGEEFETPWMQALGLDDPYIIYVNLEDSPTTQSWRTEREPYDTGVTIPEDGVELIRTVADPFNPGSQARVVIDRINARFGLGLGGPNFNQVVTAMGGLAAPDGDCGAEPPGGLPWPRVIPIGTDSHWIQWSHVTRAWGNSLSPSDRSPRFVFSNKQITTGEDTFTIDTNGDVVGLDSAFPARFDNGTSANGGVYPGYPDKGFDGDQGDGHHLNFAFQMLWKDGDIEQLGELLNIFGRGHLILYAHTLPPQYDRTIQTFSEWLREDAILATLNPDVRAGRLDPFRAESVINEGFEEGPLPPALPAAARVLECFTLDGTGYEILNTPDDQYRLAHAFIGRAVHGMININTAPVEVLRMLPHAARLIHAGGIPGANGGFTVQPRSAIAETIVQARELYNGDVNFESQNSNTGYQHGPSYFDRQMLVTNLRSGRGFASKGELLLLNKPATLDPIIEFNQLPIKAKAWGFDFAANTPFEDATTTPPIASAYLSTDLTLPDPINDPLEGDEVAADVEEQNLLFAGMANMITTRSDTFTVYFRVRSFRQNSVTGVWDATDPEYIVDDSRYVMLVDRSEVNSPNDKPRILYLEKLPN